jgi:hypothetical protein
MLLHKKTAPISSDIGASWSLMDGEGPLYNLLLRTQYRPADIDLEGIVL